jgi:hypothetical protein
MRIARYDGRRCDLELNPALGSGNANLLVGLHLCGIRPDMLGSVSTPQAAVFANRGGSVRTV